MQSAKEASRELAGGQTARPGTRRRPSPGQKEPGSKSSNSEGCRTRLRGLSRTPARAKGCSDPQRLEEHSQNSEHGITAQKPAGRVVLAGGNS